MLTTIERDVVQLSGIREVAEMGQLLRLFAARTGRLHRRMGFA